MYALFESQDTVPRVSIAFGNITWSLSIRGWIVARPTLAWPVLSTSRIVVLVVMILHTGPGSFKTCDLYPRRSLRTSLTRFFVGLKTILASCLKRVSDTWMPNSSLTECPSFLFIGSTGQSIIIHRLLKIHCPELFQILPLGQYDFLGLILSDISAWNRHSSGRSASYASMRRLYRWTPTLYWIGVSLILRTNSCRKLHENVISVF